MRAEFGLHDIDAIGEHPLALRIPGGLVVVAKEVVSGIAVSQPGNRILAAALPGFYTIWSVCLHVFFSVFELFYGRPHKRLLVRPIGDARRLAFVASGQQAQAYAWQADSIDPTAGMVGTALGGLAKAGSNFGSGLWGGTGSKSPLWGSTVKKSFSSTSLPLDG